MCLYEKGIYSNKTTLIDAMIKAFMNLSTVGTKSVLARSS